MTKRRRQPSSPSPQLDFHEDPHCLCLLVPISKKSEAFKALSHERNEFNVATVRFPSGDCETGHIVRLGLSSTRTSSFSIGNGPDDDLYLHSPFVQAQHLKIFNQSYGDHDSHQQYSIMLRRHPKGAVQIDDPFVKSGVTQGERMVCYTRCVNRMTSLKIGLFEYRVLYPDQSHDVKQRQKDLYFATATEASPDIDLFEDIRQQALLGRGSFGSVYKVRSAYSGRFYARKEIAVSFIEKPQRLLREVDSMRLVDSDHVVSGVKYDVSYCDQEISRDDYDSDATIPILYIYMPLMTTSLLTFMNKGWHEALWLPVFSDIVGGVADMHHVKTVHRDLKPDNVLLLIRNGQIQAKISDLGLSVTLREEATMTSGGGNIYFQAPEIYKNRGLGLSADVYSLAVLFIQIRNPRTFKTKAERNRPLQVHAGSWAADLRKLTRDLKLGVLEGWILAMLNDDPSMRPLVTELSQVMARMKSGTQVPTFARVLTERRQKQGEANATRKKDSKPTSTGGKSSSTQKFARSPFTMSEADLIRELIERVSGPLPESGKKPSQTRPVYAWDVGGPDTASPKGPSDQSSKSSSKPRGRKRKTRATVSDGGPVPGQGVRKRQRRRNPRRESVSDIKSL